MDDLGEVQVVQRRGHVPQQGPALLLPPRVLRQRPVRAVPRAQLDELDLAALVDTAEDAFQSNASPMANYAILLDCMGEVGLNSVGRKINTKKKRALRYPARPQSARVKRPIRQQTLQSKASSPMPRRRPRARRSPRRRSKARPLTPCST